MKIAFLCAHFPPHFRGGTECVALAQARALADLGHRVRVVAGTDRHPGKTPGGADDEVLPDGGLERLQVEGLPVTFVPRSGSERIFDLALERPRLAATLAHEVADAEIVHLFPGSTLDGGLVRHLARRVPVVLSLHDLFSTCPRFFRTPPQEDLQCPGRDRFEPCARCVADEAPGSPRAELEAAMAARATAWRGEVAAARRVIVPSRTHLVRLAEFLDFGPGQVRILGPGLCQSFPPRRRRPRPWDGKRPLRVLHPGRRSEPKGTLDLVRALAALPAGSVELVAPGGADPGLDQRLRAAAGALPLELGGPYRPEDLAHLARSCHLAALPSRLPESYSLVVDEALALGLPTWVAGGEAARERFGPPALTALPPGDPEAWRGAFEVWLADPALAREASEALPDVLPTARESARSLERWFAELLSDPDAPTEPVEGFLSPPRHHRRPA